MMASRTLRSTTKRSIPSRKQTINDTSAGDDAVAKISPIATRRSTRRSTQNKSIDGDDAPASGQKRRTEVPEPSRALKRQRTQPVIEFQGGVESEVGASDDKDESAPQGVDFYERINESIGNNKRAREPTLAEQIKSQLEQEDSEQDEGEGEEEFDGDAEEEGEESVNGDQQQSDGGSRNSEEQEGEEDEPLPSVSSMEVAKSNRRRSRRRQSKRAPYDDADYISRPASPELGHGVPEPEQDGPRDQPVTITQRRSSSHAGNQKESSATDREDGDASLHQSKSPTPEGQGRSTAQAVANGVRRDEFEEDQEEAIAAPEDSILFSVPEESLLTVDIPSKVLMVAAKKMRLHGWTNEALWRSKFIPVDDEEETMEEWFEQHDSALKTKLCKDLFNHLHALRQLFEDFPKAPNFTELNGQLISHQDDLNRSIAVINATVNSICRRISVLPVPQGPSDGKAVKYARNTIESCYKKLIPMLILVLQEAFMLGGFVIDNDDEPFPDEDGSGQFLSSVIELMVRVLGWTKRLYTVVQGVAAKLSEVKAGTKTALRLRESDQRQRLKVGEHLVELQHLFKRGLDGLRRQADLPRRQQIAQERARQLQIALEQKERERQEAEARQWQLYIESTQRMALNRSRGSSARSQRPQFGQSDEYYEQHGGWYYYEDDKLLAMIRRTLNPNVEALSQFLPGRSVQEVEQRVNDLKRRMRRKYEESNMMPPQWCYLHHE